ncbi:MAG: phosphoribosylamine--glycine ligase, partial [Actinomycetota bacterium]|nr:phosphoribosylamine--glycine ligase [Actinomycetota bacterium]
LPMQPVQDFKRLLDGDQGPNTGGMGAYTPLPWVAEGLLAEVEARVLRPAVAELARRGNPFVGLLYAGLALTTGGVQVVEFNARFGDPETQALLPLLESPLGQVLHAAATGRLDEIGPLRWRTAAAVTVVLAAAGYPESPRQGDVITGIDRAEAIDAVQIAHAGTSLGPDGLATAGGRVLAVTAHAHDLASARALAYQGVEAISFEGAQHRNDIAAHAAEPTRPLG